jgi:DNA-binding CsgD family transcriptional regulator
VHAADPRTDHGPAEGHRNNVSNIFAKLHVADRAEAIVRARDAGLGRS